jgi:anti-sigma regulatory factor (Ser/Thr protein kinase)
MEVDGLGQSEKGGAMTEQTTLDLKNDVSELERVMNLLGELCVRNSLPPDIEYDLNLALDEMVSNVARHAYPNGGEHHFSLQVTLNDKEFIARLEDDGIEFDPTKYPVPDLDCPLEERKEGGLGIYLVRQIMTSIEYQRVAGKNIVTLRKTLA